MGDSSRNRGLGGALRMRDKQAYYGLLVVIIAVLGFGAYKLIRLAASELRAMPNDDPDMEMSVDELRIHKVEEQDAILMGDSLSQQYNLDSIKRKVQIDTRPVYRPPRRLHQTQSADRHTAGLSSAAEERRVVYHEERVEIDLQELPHLAEDEAERRRGEVI